jgi:hypothetical protein
MLQHKNVRYHLHLFIMKKKHGLVYIYRNKIV